MAPFWSIIDIWMMMTPRSGLLSSFATISDVVYTVSPTAGIFKNFQFFVPLVARMELFIFAIMGSDGLMDGVNV